MVIVADSDCIRKLAYCNFLGEFLQLIGVPPNDIWVLPALAHQLRRKLFDCQGALLDFENFFKKVKFIPKASAVMLVRFESLDVGEQQIFSLFCEIDRVELLVTGDKRAIAKVAGLVHKDPDLGKLMEGSGVWCFETIILRLLEKRGFGIVKARMENWRKLQGENMDCVMSSIFSGECTELSVVAELNSRVNGLKASCIGVPIQ